MQSSAGSTSATVVFVRRGLIAWPLGFAFVAAGLVGGVAGAASAAHLSRGVLQAAVPLILLGVAGYFLLSRRPGDEDRRARLPVGAFALLAVAPIGFYDGIFGPGTGAFLTIAFVGLLGYGITRATAHSKLSNAASNWGALGFFALSGRVDWRFGLVMAAGAVLGGQIGSRLALRHGARLIKPILVVVAGAMAIKLLADPANPLRPGLGGGVALRISRAGSAARGPAPACGPASPSHAPDRYAPW